jgi:hypothetical protein
MDYDKPVSPRGDDCLSFNLDPPPGIKQGGDHKHRGDGLMLAENLAVRPAHSVRVGGINEVHPGADDVGDAGTETVERTEDDLKAPPRLGPWVGVDLAARRDGRRSGDEDPVSDSDGPAEADLILEW